MRKRKILAIIICIALTASIFCTPALASNEKAAYNTDKITLTKTNDGTWTSNPQNTYSIQSNSETVSVSLDSEYEGIYKTENNQYFQKIADSTYVPAEKISLPLTSYSSYQELEGYNIPEEMAEDIATMAAFAQKNNCEHAGVTIFVNDNTTNSGMCSLMTTQNTMPRETTTWNGMTFYHYQIYFTSMWTQPQQIKKGTTLTSAVASAITSLVMNVAGTNQTIGTAMSIYDVGKTCLQAWTDVTQSTPIYGRTDNAAYVNVCYNILNKYTYMYDPVYQRYIFGYATQKARIIQIDNDTYFYTSCGGQRCRGKVKL